MLLNFECFNSVINRSEGEIKTSEIEGKVLSIHSVSFLFCDTYFKGNRLLGFLQQCTCSVFSFRTCKNCQGWLVLLRSYFIISDREFLEFLLFPLSIIQWLECGTIKKVTLHPLRERCGILSCHSGCE